MSIATTVGDALEFEGVDFRILRSGAAKASPEDLREAGLEPEGCVRAVLLKDPNGYLLTVTAATRVPDIAVLRQELHRDLVPAAREDLDELFCDCTLGSVPPLGPWYRIPTIVDTRLKAQASIYFDAGEPDSLVEVSERSFEKLLEGAEYFAFSRRART